MSIISNLLLFTFAYSKFLLCSSFDMLWGIIFTYFPNMKYYIQFKFSFELYILFHHLAPLSFF